MPVGFQCQEVGGVQGGRRSGRGKALNGDFPVLSSEETSLWRFRGGGGKQGETRFAHRRFVGLWHTYLRIYLWYVGDADASNTGGHFGDASIAGEAVQFPEHVRLGELPAHGMLCDTMHSKAESESSQNPRRILATLIIAPPNPSIPPLAHCDTAGAGPSRPPSIGNISSWHPSSSSPFPNRTLIPGRTSGVQWRGLVFPHDHVSSMADASSKSWDRPSSGALHPPRPPEPSTSTLSSFLVVSDIGRIVLMSTHRPDFDVGQLYLGERPFQIDTHE